jgi:hypothetical protein
MEYNFFSETLETCHKGFFANTTYPRTWAEELYDNRKNFDPNVEYVNYKLNNFGHRCDNFKKQHEKRHVLFAGCSFTFGEGLGYKENWSGQLYSKIEKEYDCDGYYSLGFQNGFISHIVYSVLKYCEQFGNPEFLFCFFPDAVRKITHDKKDNFIISYQFNDIESAEGRARAYYSIYFLEKYCQINNIKLYWSSWHKEDSEYYGQLPFKRFFHIKEEEILLHSDNSQKNHPLYRMARDRAHPGLRYSSGLANVFYNILKEEYDETDN